MDLTPEQKQELRRAKAAGEKRIYLQFTEAQKKAWQVAVEEEWTCKEDNIAQSRKIQTAAQKPGFFGDVRRAIILSRRPAAEFAAAIGVDPHLFSDFRAGEADLPAAALERLIESLGLRLMQEIPR